MDIIDLNEADRGVQRHSVLLRTHSLIAKGLLLGEGVCRGVVHDAVETLLCVWWCVWCVCVCVVVWLL